ncbi:DNA gyrase inhibitor YacG [Usitatibacter palustris]|uniref:DNA gyrase inhibitor YacG n=1 Tax=Usitatibacter palustris TaxID=2732487 RepID=UPI001FE47210|nr:DNA gyrase inhibitor YacG [Usitatibacter palustris]
MKKVACPTCGTLALFSQANPWRPFCTERCRLIDLGAWATESYAIPAKPGEDDLPENDSDPESR